MKPRDVFELIIRALGLWFVWYALQYFLEIPVILLGIPMMEIRSIPSDTTFGLVYFVLGCWLLFMPKMIVQVTYGRTENSN